MRSIVGPSLHFAWQATRSVISAEAKTGLGR